MQHIYNVINILDVPQNCIKVQYKDKCPKLLSNTTHVLTHRAYLLQLILFLLQFNMHAKHEKRPYLPAYTQFFCLYPSNRIHRYKYSRHKHTCMKSRTRFHVLPLPLLSWVDFSDSVELLWGAKNSFDVNNISS